MRKRTDGFTLVELMVVVLIIGILAAIAVPVFNAAKADAEKSVCYANQRTLEGAYQQYCADSGLTPPEDIRHYVTAGYLKKEPVCPSWASDRDHYYELGNHHYYFYSNSGHPGDIWMYRPTAANKYLNEGIRGCFKGIAGHGYYATPGEN